jgi:hypothetical protein
MQHARISKVAVAFLCIAWCAPAHADEPPAPAPSAAPPARADEPAAPDDSPAPVLTKDVRSEVPNLAYAYTAHGASAKSLGAMAYGLGVGAAGQKGILGGGVTVWGSPIDRLTLVGDAQRNVFGNFSPSFAAIVRLLGKADDGWSLGALGKFKVEGFGRPGGLGTPPAEPDEIESELETGLLLSYGRDGYHLDVNAIAGFGMGDDGEIDTEGRVRLGYDVTRMLRVGVDGQGRVRANGPQYLPNGKTSDFAAGPQLVVGSKAFFGSLTGGPATMGLISDRVGWNVVASVGGTTF